MVKPRRRLKKEKMEVFIAVKVTKSMKDRLESIAQRKNVSISDLVRWAISDFLEAMKNEEGSSGIRQAVRSS